MIYFQDEIEATCPDLLKLGLLSEVGIDVATLRDQSPCVSFHHKSLQDYSASKHVVQTLEESPNMKVIYQNRTYINTCIHRLNRLDHTFVVVI